MAPSAAAIPVRDLRFGLSERTPRYWFDGDPAKTHVMNALSTTFPEGEAFFVRSVLHYQGRVDDEALRARIRGFAGQEGMHSREHDAHVELLVDQGYPGVRTFNRMEERETRFWNRRAPLFALATTAALEHLTAIMARRALSEPDYWAGPMHPDMARMWQWHAMEEAEHKSVAFDVLRIVSGSWLLRIVAMLFATFGLLMDTLVRWLYFTAKDGNLLRPGLWADATRFLWGRGGLYRSLIPDYVKWYRRDFHPDQDDDRTRIAACRERLAI
jgi:predicted metal-dependent hydrolase